MNVKLRVECKVVKSNLKFRVKWGIKGWIRNSRSNVKISVESEIQEWMWNSGSNVNFRVECEIQGWMWNSESNKKFIFQHGIIVPNEKLLSAECECESEWDGNFYLVVDSG